MTEKKEINLGLERILELLEKLGNPHLKLPPTIHIAGTNGKGSTLSFLRSIFSEAGLKVHAYTSPHLVKFNERIILAGKEISDEFLDEVLNECKKTKVDATFFELTTAAAFLAFSRVEADILLLETGLGGRLDATNVLPEVLCSVITPIDFDHQEFLGDTLAKIAFEKAGIMKKGCLVVVGKQREEVLEVLENRAAELGCKIEIFGKDFDITRPLSFDIHLWCHPEPVEGRHHDGCFRHAPFDRLRVTPEGDGKAERISSINKLDLGLKGSHQFENAAVATQVALSQNKFPISAENIKNGLEKTFWPARLQKIISGKFFEKLPKNFELYLDGSHNLQGANTVLEFIKSQKNKKKFVIFGMLKNKDCEGFLKIIAEEITQLIAVEIAEESNSRKALDITKIAQKNNINSVTANNFSDAFTKIKCDEDAIILVCGSLYLAGNFLRENFTT